jgi:hypothetical protein
MDYAGGPEAEKAEDFVIERGVDLLFMVIRNT